MKTTLAEQFRNTVEGQEAEAILRSCVHCGFCTATCPTYQLLGDERDGPRGRIYLIKQVLEGTPASARTQQHLDQCLTCLNCETTCPSGVEYGRLVDIGRKVVDSQVPRPLGQRLLRTALVRVLTRRWLFDPLMRMAQQVRPLLPPALRAKVPRRQAAGTWPQATYTRRMLLLDGCVQPAMAPNINAATARVLDRLGVQLVVAGKAGCCGAIAHHLSQEASALDAMRRNIDAWWPWIEGGPDGAPVEAIVITASGCGSTVKDYGHLLAQDPRYALKAARVAELARDLSEVLAPFEAQLSALLAPLAPPNGARIAYHPPCSLQHDQRVRGSAERLLRLAGYEVRLCADSHTCCGSAGTYSILQPELAYPLRDNKLANLEATGATSIATANIGCLTHLASGTALPVEHWIELVDRRLNEH